MLLIEASIPYRNEYISNCDKWQILEGEIVGMGEVPNLDEEGRYNVKLLVPDKAQEHIELNVPVRLMQPSVGMHFPLLPTTKVVLGFFEGDINQPVIIGVMNDKKHPSPVTDKNCQQNIIKSYDGNMLVIDDNEEKNSILIATSELENRVKMTAVKDKQEISLDPR